MSYSVNKITTVADCDLLLAWAVKEKADLNYKKLSEERLTNNYSETSIEIDAELQSVISEIAATETIPSLKGKFGGLSLRVPTPVVSIADFVVLLNRKTSKEEINETLRKAAAEPYYQGILAVTDEELVSSDFIGNSYSSIVDLSLTDVVDGDLVKVVSWYDNEWGYSNRLVELTADVAKTLGQ